MNAVKSERRVTRSFTKTNKQPASGTKHQGVILPQTTASSYRRQPKAPDQLKSRKKNADNKITQLQQSALKSHASVNQAQKALNVDRRTPGTLKKTSVACVVPIEEFSKCSSSQTVDHIDSLFHCKELLGEGTYGAVYRSVRKQTNEVVALKRLNESSNEGVPATSTREVLLLQKLNHPNIVKMKEVIIESHTTVTTGKCPRLWLEFEYCELDLRKYMKLFENRRMPVETIRSVIFQLLQGLSYCHERGIVHRDLKPNNILLRIKRTTTNTSSNKRPASEAIQQRRPSSQRRRTIEVDQCEVPEDNDGEGAAQADRRREESSASDDHCSDVDQNASSTEKSFNDKSKSFREQQQRRQSDDNNAMTTTSDRQPEEELEVLTTSPTEEDYRHQQQSQRLLRTDVEIKIADFGLARVIPYPLTPMTHEVVTLWYRAPEILLGLAEYTSAIDLWSVGCCFLELLYGRPLFGGDSEIDTLFRIFRFLGTPTADTWPNIEDYRYYQTAWPSWPRRSDRYDWLREDEDIGIECKHLIDRLLCYDYRCRITCQEALQHPWFAPLRNRPL